MIKQDKQYRIFQTDEDGLPIPQMNLDEDGLPIPKIVEKKSPFEGVGSFASSIKSSPSKLPLQEEDNDDPIGNILKEYKNAQERALKDLHTVQPIGGYNLMAIPKATEQAPLHQKYDEATKALNEATKQSQKLFPNTKGAIDFLTQVAEKHGGNLPENNATVDLALKRVQEKKVVNEAASKFSNFDDFATNIYGGKNANQLSEAARGTYIDEALNNPAVIEKAKEDPEFNKHFLQAYSQIYNNNPSYGNKKLGTDIGQMMEDKNMNGGWAGVYSNPGVEKTDEAVKMLMDSGKWGVREKAYYDRTIRPIVEAGHASRVIPLTDFAHKVGYSLYEGAENYNKSMRGVVNFLGGNFLDPNGNSLFQNLGLLKTNQQEQQEAEQRQFGVSNVEAKGFKGAIEKPFTTAAHIAPMILAGAVGVPEAANMALMFGSGNEDRANQLFKGNDLKSRALRLQYTLLSTTADMFLMKALPINKMLDARKEIEPEIKKIITSLSNGEIAQAEVKPLMLRAIEKLPKEAINTANVLTAYQYLHKGLDAAAGQRDLKSETDNRGIVDNYLENLLSGAGLAAFSAFGAAANQKKPTLDGKVYQEYANNYDAVREMFERKAQENPEQAADIAEKLDNLDHIKKVNDELNSKVDKKGNQKYNDEQKQRLLALSLRSKVSSEKIESLPDKALADEKEIKDIEKEKKEILDNPIPPKPEETFPEGENIPSQEKTTTPSTVSGGEGGDVESTAKKIVGESAFNKLKKEGYTIEKGKFDSDAYASFFGVHTGVQASEFENAGLKLVKPTNLYKGEDGKPVTFYHGTDKEFSEFKPSENKHEWKGIFFAFDKDYAQWRNSKRIIEANLDVKNPLDVTVSESEWAKIPEDVKEAVKKQDIEFLKLKGYDAVILKKPLGKEIVVFDKSQIKPKEQSTKVEEQKPQAISSEYDFGKVFGDISKSFGEQVAKEVKEGTFWTESEKGAKQVLDKLEGYEIVPQQKTFYPKGKEPITREGFTLKPKPQAISSKEEVGDRQSQINDLMDDIRAFNKLPKNAKNRSYELNQLKLRANDLNLEFDDSYGKLYTKEGKSVYKISSDKPSSLSPDFNETEYSGETKQHAKILIDNPDALNGLPILGNDGRQLSRKQMESALKSVVDGKPTRAAKSMYDFIEDAVRNGNVEVTDRTTGQSVKVPTDEYFSNFKEPVKPLTDEEITQLNWELSEDSFNFNDEYHGQEIIPSETQSTPTGKAKPSAEELSRPTKTPTVSRKTSQEKLSEKTTEIHPSPEVKEPIKGEADKNIQPTSEGKTEKPTQITENQPTGEPPIKPPKETVGEGEDGEKLSGIKKALVSEDIIKGVDLERIPDNEMMALGRKILDSGEVKPRELVEKITTEKRGVLKPEEVVALITYKADLDNRASEVYSEINKRKEAGEDIGTLGVEAKNIERDILDYEIMSVITAQQQSLAFRLRQKLLDKDYNVVTQIEKYKANNDGYIPPEVEAKFKELDKQLKEVNQKLSEAERKLSEKEGQESIQNIKESSDREKKYSEEELEKKVQEGVQSEINKIYEQLPSEKKSLADKAISALERIQKNLRSKQYSDATGFVAILDAGITTIKNAIKLGVAVERAVELGINKIKEKLKGQKWDKEDEFRKDMIEGFAAEGVSSKKEISLNKDGSLNIPESKLKEAVKSGITDINDLTDKIHKEAIKIKPDATKREVRDAITDYGKKVNPTKDQVQLQLNTAKRIGRLLSEVEDLQNKKAKEKNPSTAAKLTAKERELKRQIKALEKDAGIEHKRSLTEEEKLSEAKNRVRSRISELERRLKNKDFSTKKELPQQKDDELVRLEAEKEKLQEEFDNEQYKLKLKNRTVWQKVEDVAVELTSGVVRGLVASFDLSAGFVQGLYRMFVDFGKSGMQLLQGKRPSPNRTIEAFKVMFKHLVSQKASDDYLARIKSSEAYPLIKASKLAIDDKSGHVSAKEGFFISNWVNLIWNHAIAPAVSMPISIFTKGNVRKGYDIAKAINPYLASQRAFDGYINAIRVNSFKDMAKSIQKDGYNYESNPEVFEKAADFINTTTGRGSLGAAEQGSKWLNIFLFAPRKVVSEVKLFTPYAFAYYAKMPKPVRTRALQNLATFLTTFVGANALLWAANRKDDEDDNFWNPNSTDFLTHKIGNKRINIAGGAKSMIVFQSRLLTGRFVDQYGQETKLGDRFGKQINTRFDLITNFIAGKTSPFFSVGIQKLQERKGLEVDDAELIKNLSVPIWLQDLKEMYKKDPATVNAIVTALSIFGANVRTVKESGVELTKEIKENPTFKFYLDKGLNLPNVRPENTPIQDEKHLDRSVLSDYPKETQDRYAKLHLKYLEEELRNWKNEGWVWVSQYKDKDGNRNISLKEPKDEDKAVQKRITELSKEQYSQILHKAQAAASTKTKKEMFNQ